MNSFLQGRCPQCGALATTSQELLGSDSYTCTKCEHLFSIEDQALSPPPGIRIKKTPSEVVLSWSWFRPDQLIILVFVLAFLGVAYTFIVFSNLQGFAHFIALPFIALALWQAWSLARGFINRTTLTASKNALSVVHGPLSLSKHHRELSPDDLEQVFCVLNPQRRFANIEVRTLENASVHILLTHLKNAPRALFIEQVLENFYGIEDRVMRGEIDKSARSAKASTKESL